MLTAHHGDFECCASSAGPIPSTCGRFSGSATRLGIPFQREDWGRGFRSTDDPEFLAINPVGLVPAVIDDGHVLREFNTIVRYLCSKHGADHLYPRDPLQRAAVEQWMDWANYETSISLRGAFLGGQLNEPPWNNPWFVE